MSSSESQSAELQLDETIVAHLLDLEAERCRAITELDLDVLASLLADDFTYGFLSARIEDKSTYLAGLPARPHRITRNDLAVRVYGDAAVMTGEFETFDVDTREVLNAGTGLQVWIRAAGAPGGAGNASGSPWRIVALTTTRFGARSTHWGEQPS